MSICVWPEINVRCLSQLVTLFFCFFEDSIPGYSQIHGAAEVDHELLTVLLLSPEC